MEEIKNMDLEYVDIDTNKDIIKELIEQGKTVISIADSVVGNHYDEYMAQIEDDGSVVWYKIGETEKLFDDKNNQDESLKYEIRALKTTLKGYYDMITFILIFLIFLVISTVMLVCGS